MITSDNQRKMRRISPNNPVRRRLVFGDEIEDQTKLENFENKMRESIAQEVKEKSEKWGFDFKNDVPINGPYIWTKTDVGKWKGVPKNDDVKLSTVPTDDDKISDIEYNNENTPVQVRNENVPIIKTRKNNIEQRVIRQSVKRKMDFDDASFAIRRCCSNS